MLELILLAALLIKHFIADFVLQTDAMVREKSQYGKIGGITHSSIHGVGTFLVFALAGFGIIALICAVIDAVVHYHIDWSKMQLSRGLTPKDQTYWVYLGLDQMLHQLTYVFLVAVAFSF